MRSRRRSQYSAAMFKALAASVPKRQLGHVRRAKPPLCPFTNNFDISRLQLHDTTAHTATAAMPPTTAYPASKVLASTVLAPSAAASTLQSFLTQTSSSAHLHPDALLTTAGIQFSANSGPTGGLAIHHLHRIAAGLRRETLALESREELEAQFAAEMGLSDDTRLNESIDASEGKGKRSRSMERVREWEDGAQDLETFQREQHEVLGEVGRRDEAMVEQTGEVPEVKTGGDGKVDKAARNAAKKARRAAERKEKLKG